MNSVSVENVSFIKEMCILIEMGCLNLFEAKNGMIFSEKLFQKWN